MKEIDKKEINNKAEIDKRLSNFYNQLNYINNSLDILRNRFFNLIITRMYIKDINFDYQKIIDNITDWIGRIDLDYIELVNKLNLSFGDKQNEINKYTEAIINEAVSKEMNQEGNKKRDRKTTNNNNKKIKEENLICSELKTILEDTEQNLTD